MVISGDESIPGGIAVSLFIGIIYGGIKYKLYINSIRHNGPGNPQVVIMPQALIINRHYNPLTGENLWFEKAGIKNEEAFTIPEITYGWHTRNCNTNDEIRVPVPAGKETEAEQIIRSFYAYYKTA